MRLICPHCAVAYDVPPSLLAGRRAVRCARCKQEWVEQEGVAIAVPAPVAEPAATASPPAPEPLVPASLRAEAALARPGAAAARASAARLGWAGSVLLLAIGAWSAVAWRSDVMHAWPPSGRLYAALGLSGQ